MWGGGGGIRGQLSMQSLEGHLVKDDSQLGASLTCNYNGNHGSKAESVMDGVHSYYQVTTRLLPKS